MSENQTDIPRAEQLPEERPLVLVVSASAEVRRRRRRALEDAGFDVAEAADGLEALRRAVRRGPEVVLVDQNLPWFSGADVVRRFRAEPGVNRSVVVGIGAADDRPELLQAGCDGFISESLGMPALPLALRAYLDGRRDTPPSGAPINPQLERLKREMAQLSGAQERTRAQLQARRDVMHDLAHEFATPLTPLVGYLKLLGDARLGPLNEKQQKVVDAMRGAADRLSRSVDSLVDFSALESGQYRLRREETDVARMLDDCVREVYPRLRPKHLTMAPRHGQAVVLSADAAKLRQAVKSLLDNAIRVSPHGGHVLVDLYELDDRVHLYVYDQGSGLSDAQRPADRAAPEGAVLELPVARQIVEAHGGEFVVESPPREQPSVRNLFPGSKVGFWLPKG